MCLMGRAADCEPQVDLINSPFAPSLTPHGPPGEIKWRSWRLVVQKRWPERLWIVRHGQSAGNVARDAADAAGLPQIDIAVRDADVPLSRLGEEQSVALGRWFSAMAVDERPNVVLISPYRRAKQTAELIGSVGGIAEDSPELIVDERLREKEFGIPRPADACRHRAQPSAAGRVPALAWQVLPPAARGRELVRRDLAATQRA